MSEHRISAAATVAAAAAAAAAFSASGGARGWRSWCGGSFPEQIVDLAHYASAMPVITAAVYDRAADLGLHDGATAWREAPKAVRTAFCVFHGACERLRCLERAGSISGAVRRAAAIAPPPVSPLGIDLEDADDTGGFPARKGQRK